ncbi:hypothetical protein ABZ840_23495 [Streptomyces sp. NPDC047117]|uniref:hypothetical protein n=1 Tax=Streptomyces sp. NPDC047117 TaxID=3155379 RepID=UPI0033E50989
MSALSGLAGNRSRGVPIIDEELPGDPFELYSSWCAEIRRDRGAQGVRAVLATSGGGVRPSMWCTRVVRLPGGFACFLHHRGRIGAALASHPEVSLAFDWSERGRSVLATGRCARLPAVDSDAFFGRLTEREQLAVWTGGMQEEGHSRAAVAAAAADFADRFSGQLIPRPGCWGGYRITVDEMLFQQGSDDGVTDCFRYGKPPGEEEWNVVRSTP